MRIGSWLAILAAATGAIVLFVMYAVLLAVGLEAASSYFRQGCEATGSGALMVGTPPRALCLEFWLFRYQTLIGGILALGGAYLAFSAVRQQIAQAEGHAQDRRDRDSNAARSVVTHALSKLNTYAGECTSALRKHKPPPGRTRTVDPIVMPPFPDEAIPILQEAVRHSDPEVAAKFADIIAHSQIQRSRISFIVEVSAASPIGGVSFTDVQNNIATSIDLYVRTGRLFNYGRKFLNRSTLDDGRFAEALRLLDFQEDDWPILAAHLRAHERLSERSSEGAN